MSRYTHPLARFVYLVCAKRGTIRAGVAGRNEVVTKLRSVNETGGTIRATALEKRNCAFYYCALSGVTKRFRQFGCTQHVRDAFQVVSNRGNADFGSRTGQATHE